MNNQRHNLIYRICYLTCGDEDLGTKQEPVALSHVAALTLGQLVVALEDRREGSRMNEILIAIPATHSLRLKQALTI